MTWGGGGDERERASSMMESRAKMVSFFLFFVRWCLQPTVVGRFSPSTGQFDLGSAGRDSPGRGARSRSVADQIGTWGCVGAGRGGGGVVIWVLVSGGRGVLLGRGLSGGWRAGVQRRRLFTPSSSHPPLHTMTSRPCVHTCSASCSVLMSRPSSCFARAAAWQQERREFNPYARRYTNKPVPGR
jgi:hypothetical protein